MQCLGIVVLDDLDVRIAVIVGGSMGGKGGGLLPVGELVRVTCLILMFK